MKSNFWILPALVLVVISVVLILRNTPFRAEFHDEIAIQIDIMAIVGTETNHIEINHGFDHLKIMAIYLLPRQELAGSIDLLTLSGNLRIFSTGGKPTNYSLDSRNSTPVLNRTAYALATGIDVPVRKVKTIELTLNEPTKSSPFPESFYVDIVLKYTN